MRAREREPRNAYLSAYCAYDVCAGLPACLPTACVYVCVCACVCVFVHKKQTNKNVISLTNKIDFYCIPLATQLPSFSSTSACFFLLPSSLLSLYLPHTFRFSFRFLLFISPSKTQRQYYIYVPVSVTLHLSIAAARDERVESRFRFHMS